MNYKNLKENIIYLSLMMFENKKIFKNIRKSLWKSLVWKHYLKRKRKESLVKLFIGNISVMYDKRMKDGILFKKKNKQKIKGF